MNAEEQLKNIRTAGGRSLHDTPLKKSRIIALVLTSAALVSLLFLVFAFSQKQRADQLDEELARVKQELVSCQQH
jgi:hypothetical protein